MKLEIRNGIKYYGQSYRYTSRKIQSVIQDMYIENDIVSKLIVTERVESKFMKPSVDENSTYMYVFIGGWRFVSQQRESTVLNGDVRMYGKTFSTSNNVLHKASPTSVYRVVTPEGLVIAEVLEHKTINILFDIIGIDADVRDILIAQIFTDIFTNYLRIDFEDIKEKRKQKEEQRKQEEIDRTAKFLLSLSGKELEKVEQELTNKCDSIKYHESEISRLISDRDRLMRQANSYRSQMENGVEGINKELQLVKAMDRVDDVFIDSQNEQLVVHTNDIFIINSNKRYYIGKFKIYISPKNGRVKFENLNNRRKSYWNSKCHHPHVDEVGYACWGNVGTAISTYIQQNEFQALTSLLIGFLESVNSADAAGRNITSWDVVNNAGEVIQEGYDYSRPPRDVEVFTCFACQDSFNRNGISISRNGKHICTECAKNHFVCPDCGDVISTDDAEHCEACGQLICEECYMDNTKCSPCRDREELEASLEEGQSVCPFCKEIINDESLLTCETCGEQGCSSCIQFDGRYSCPEHR